MMMVVVVKEGETGPQVQAANHSELSALCISLLFQKFLSRAARLQPSAFRLRCLLFLCLFFDLLRPFAFAIERPHSILSVH